MQEGEEERVPPFKRAEQRRGRGGSLHKGFSPALSAGLQEEENIETSPPKNPIYFLHLAKPGRVARSTAHLSA